jgi:hypothetical protein
MNDVLPADQPLILSGEEVLFVRLASALSSDDESPLEALAAPPPEPILERSGRALFDRRLLDGKTMRPHREVLRRLLVVAQPDSRIVLLRAGAGQGERLMDLYGRSGAFVRYAKTADKFRFGPPLEILDVLDEVVRIFSPRRSTGDFVDLRLTPHESFAFTFLASELVAGLRNGAMIARLLRTPPPARKQSALLDHSIDGAMVLSGKRISRLSPALFGEDALASPVPSDIEWIGALEGLLKKDVIYASGDGFELRPYLRDLAIGLMTQNRHVLTRFDFGARDWVVRDVTFVPVSGSVFSVRATREGGMTVKELDARGLNDGVRKAIEEISIGETVDGY